MPHMALGGPSPSVQIRDQLSEAPGNRPPRVVSNHELPSAFAHLLPRARISQELADCARKRLRVLRFYHEPGTRALDGFPSLAARSQDYRPGAGHRIVELGRYEHVEHGITAE